ncbi:MAG: FCD domain-containing protein [Planctomycetota bacterium]|nr:FCD domain-containing protein [Planctomycetota bacterium]
MKMDISGLKKQLASTGNAANLIADHIRNQIITHELPPGFVFPSENQFSEELGVGRSTLREAYKSLESNCLITRTKRGTFVNEYATVISSMPFSTTIEMSDFSELLEFRGMVEAELAGLAAERATADSIDNMKNFLRLMKEHQDNLTELTFYDMQFHIEVATASRNHLMLNVMKVAADAFFKSIYNAFQVDTKANIRQALAYHESILFALEQGDRAMAQNAMRSHVTSVSERLYPKGRKEGRAAGRDVNAANAGRRALTAP